MVNIIFFFSSLRNETARLPRLKKSLIGDMKQCTTHFVPEGDSPDGCVGFCVGFSVGVSVTFSVGFSVAGFTVSVSFSVGDGGL